MGRDDDDLAEKFYHLISVAKAAINYISKQSPLCHISQLRKQKYITAELFKVPPATAQQFRSYKDGYVNVENDGWM